MPDNMGRLVLSLTNVLTGVVPFLADWNDSQRCKRGGNVVLKRISLALAASALLLVACSTSVPSSTARSRPPSTPTSVSIGLLGASGCHPASPMQTSAIGLTEVQGRSTNGSLWILLFADTRVGSDIKIVWRMTGTGALHLVAIGPQGQHVAPDWGPQAHSGSNWNRPGDEWGAGFTMPVTGCWDLHASRVDTSGDVWLIFTK